MFKKPLFLNVLDKGLNKNQKKVVIIIGAIF